MGILLNDFTCIMVVIILLISAILQRTKADKATKYFTILAQVVLGFLITNTITDYLEGKPDYITLSYILNVMDFLWIDVAIIAFSVYLSTFTGEVSKKWKAIMNPSVAFCYLRIIAVLVLAFTGQLFIIDENGVYHEQPLSIIPYILVILMAIMLIIVVINKRRYYSKQQLVVVIIYLVLPIVGGVFEMITNYYVFTVISITLSILLVYTTIQSGIIEQHRVKESVLEEISLTDLLTGINNRRAFYKRIETLRPTEYIGVVFADLNKLKFTNDNFGHAEGDKLIIFFTEILATVFDKKDIFRISGDEFAVIYPSDSQDAFNNKYNELIEIVKKNNTIASLGCAYGTGHLVEQLISEAEAMMYENKREYHQKNDNKR